MSVRFPVAALLVLLGLASTTIAQDSERAFLKVYLPVADAKIEVQGQETKKTGLERLFESPPIPKDKTFIYDLKATWTENGEFMTRQKSVRVSGGQTIEVDFRVADAPPAKPVPPTKPPVDPPVKPMPPVKPPVDPPAKPPVDPPVVPPVKPMPPVKPPVDPPVKPIPPKEIKLDVPYVPTPYMVVEEMLKTAKVTDKDVVIDLGCGDGRIVVKAVKDFKAKKGIGIDIDPARIKDSEENAVKEGVTAKATFKQGNVLKLTEKDLEEATVITMYLYPKVNDQLAPILKKLKPGTRIVSHDFTISDWKPDDKKELEVDGLDHTVYLWIVK